TVFVAGEDETMAKLRDQLRREGYHLSEVLEAQVEAALGTRPCAGGFLSGPAGAGKTFLAETLARIGERRTFFFQAFPGCRKEELYQTILPDSGQPSGFRTQPGVLPLAAQASLGGPTALILDEWDKTHPSTDAFLLDFLQNGRVSVPGSETTGNLKALVVFITLNDERELSEPLLRRLPMIELKVPPPALVEQALRDTHTGHAFLSAAVALYQRSLLVNLTKPATIQELRQLLDAITALGVRADWNRLVFQFVTKNWDDHELLKSAEGLPLMPMAVTGGPVRPVLNVNQYEPTEIQGLHGLEAPLMPRIQRDWLVRAPKREVQVDEASLFGVVPRTESGYDGVARAALFRGQDAGTGTDAADLKIAQVGESEIIVFQALNLERREEWGQVLKDGGELLLEAHHEGEVTRDMLLEFKKGLDLESGEDPERCRIYSLTAGEMLMRYRNMKIRWTPEVLEVVANNHKDTVALWEFLYGRRGVVLAERMVEARVVAKMEGKDAKPVSSGLPTNEQLRDDYLFVLREFRHLRDWFALIINRNLRIWGKITCNFRNLTVMSSHVGVTEFKPDKETPESKEEADAIHLFRSLTQPALDYFDAHVKHLEADLHAFVSRNGELPPAVEDGGIFGLHEVSMDLKVIKREGLKHYMRKMVREA
ncbi:MAG: AAA family ATPase, partial [Deltaproteobacteria bacterium]|nr:AAA family ATPase [Deltaproteobacteria bacterium]